MDSREAMSHIDKLFLTVDESLWLPQWSFDFWIIPYLIGKGISPPRFKEFMECAHKLLSLEIATVPAGHKARLQQQHLQKLNEQMSRWPLPGLATAA